jgi:hypothetical protein
MPSFAIPRQNCLTFLVRSYLLQNFHSSYIRSQPPTSTASRQTPRLHTTTNSAFPNNGCGTGAVTTLLEAQHLKARVKCSDLGPGKIDIIKYQTMQNSWVSSPIGLLHVRDLRTLEDDAFTHVVMNFGLVPTLDDHFLPLGDSAGETWVIEERRSGCYDDRFGGSCSLFNFPILHTFPKHPWHAFGAWKVRRAS